MSGICVGHVKSAIQEPDLLTGQNADLNYFPRLTLIV